ncbi:MAG TPA: hypothetical protein VN247_00830 [Arenimonas sp.]|nr:hypothetical protein [Arenimonas sp.]
MASCSQVPEPAPENTKTAVSGESTEFAGAWNAKGSRRSIALGKNRRGSIIELQGTMLLTGDARPGVGFHAELIGLADSETGLIGRSVWTDERGEQVYSEVQGEGDATSNRINGTFIGGTGRYANITGNYEYSWQFVIEAEDGSIQGRAVGLKGQVQLDQSTAEGDVQ